MAGLLCSVLVVLCLCGLSLAQAPECSTLDVDFQGDPEVGSNLDVCTTDSPQCCTQDFLDRIKLVARARLLAGLREELAERREDFNEIVDRILNYFTTTFPQSFANHIPEISQFGALFISQLTQTIDRQVPAFTADIDTFDADAFVQTIVSQFEEGAIGFLNTLTIGGLTDEKRTCIRNFIQNLAADAQVEISRGLQQAHRGFIAVRRILNFLGSFNRTVGLEVSERCVRRLVELSFCGRCSARLPPLCSGTCGALVRGCFAPFYTGLQRQFNNLWNVSAQLVMNVNRSLDAIFNSEGDLLNGRSLTLLGIQIATQCSLNISTSSFPGVGRKRRQDNIADLLPQEILEEIREFRGVFRYEMYAAYLDDEGPDFCRPSSNERDFCRGERGDEGDRECDSDRVCTSPCRCWDGGKMQEDDSVDFDGDGITDQENNPVFPQDIDDLIPQAKQLADPVNAFLISDEFSSIAPEGVSVPPAEPYTGPDGGGGAMSLVSSLSVLLLVSVMSFFVVM